MVVAVAPEVLAGFIAILWLAATEPIWYPALLQAIEALPGVVQGAVKGAAQGFKNALDYIAHWIDGLVHPAVALIWGTYWLAYVRVTGTPAALNAAWQAVWRVQMHVVPAAINALYNRLEGELSAIRGTIWQFYLTETAHADALYSQAIGYVQSQVHALQGTIWQFYLTETAYAQQLAGQVQQYAAGLFVQAESDITVKIAQAEAQAAAESAAAEQLAHNLFGQAQAAATSADQAIERWVQGLQQQSLDYTNTTGAAVAAWAGAAVTALEGEITNIRNEPCMRFCVPLGALGQLLEGIELAAIVALVAEAAANPQAVKGFLEEVVVPLVTDAAQTADDLLKAAV